MIDDTFSALGVADNEAALVEIERLQAATPAPADDLLGWLGVDNHEAAIAVVKTLQRHSEQLEALEAVAPADAEPVAWRWRHVNDASNTWNYREVLPGPHDEYIVSEPLYARPASQGTP